MSENIGEVKDEMPQVARLLRVIDDLLPWILPHLATPECACSRCAAWRNAMIVTGRYPVCYEPPKAVKSRRRKEKR